MQVWLHPCRAAALIEETAARADSLAEELASANSRMEELLSEIADLKQTRTQLQAQNTEQGLKLLRAAEVNDAQYKELDEINTMLERVAQMKANYEKRIARLKGKISDLRAALQREIDSSPGELEPLREPSKPPVEKPSSAAPVSESAADWYSPLDLS